MAEIVKRIHNEGKAPNPKNDPPVEVIERENSNSTDPNANQTNKVYVPVTKKQ
jgi:hypothetical protein